MAAKHFVESVYFRDNLNVACYMALADEIDALPIIQALWQAKKACYLPVLSTKADKHLQFVLYEAGMALGLNRYQVSEPQNITQVLSGPQLDVVVLPLIAFDQKGNRLGTGGGYYDRTFSFVLQSKFTQKKKPHLLGLAFELQKVTQIPSEVFDVPVEGMITEKGLIIF